MTSDKLASPTLSEASAGVISKKIDFTWALLAKKSNFLDFLQI